MAKTDAKETVEKEDQVFVIKTLETLNEKYIKKAVDSAKTIINDRQKDLNELLERGRKFVEEKIEAGLNSVKNKLNLLGKQDIEKLTSIMETLDSKIDALGKKV